MELSGKIIIALPEVSGTSKAGNPWRKREYVLETQETYPKKVFFSLFGDRADQYPLTVGEFATISFDVESREYNGRWYTELRVWKVDKNVPGAAAPAGYPAQAGAPVPPAPVNYGPATQMPGGYPQAAPAPAAPAVDLNQSENDDLPF